MAISEAQTFDYVLVGGGMAAGYAVQGIREKDETGTILILSTDRDVPYERPALTKKLWTDEEFTEADIPIIEPEKDGVVIEYETLVTSIDKDSQVVKTADGQEIGYKKLLLATGGEPQRMESEDSSDQDNVVAFRSWEDYRRVRKFAEDYENKDIVIVGGSYIGTELAANLSQFNHRIHFVYPQDVLGDNRFPKELAEEYEQAYIDHGVEVKPGTRAESYTVKPDGTILTTLSDGSELSADLLILGLGVEPRLELAKEAGLEVDDGVFVNETLQATNDSNIYVAGDISNYPDPILGRNRIEHVDHARNSGKTAGKNMAGANEPYDYTPYFYSTVFDISWKAIGTLDPELDVFIDEVDGGKVAYFLEDDQPVGILTWNVEPDLDDIRTLLKNPPSTSAALQGAIREKEDKS